jgi:DNA-binding MarR family transcriptional regulator
LPSSNINCEAARLLGITEAFRNAWDAMPMSVAALFIKIAERDLAGDPLGITEAGEAVGMSLASASRNALLLDYKLAERGAEPLGLVRAARHPRDYRRKVLKLTETGRMFYGRLASLVRT